MAGEDIEIIISGFDQPLLAETDRFQSVSNNNTSLQKLFTKWVLNKVKSEQLDKPLSLGGSHKENDAMCDSVVNGLVNVEMLLECTYEKADDLIFFHANLAMKIVNYGSVVIPFPDTVYLYPHYIMGYGLFQVKKIPEHSSPFMILQ